MAEYGPRTPERDRGHDQERLKIRLELHREQHKHRERSNDEAHAEAPQRLARLLPLPLPADPNQWIVLDEIGHQPLLHVGGHHLTCEGTLCDVDVSRYGDRPLLPQPVDLGIPAGHVHVGQFTERPLHTVGARHPDFIERGEAAALVPRIADHQLHLVPSPLEPHHLLAVIARPDRGGEIGQRHPHRLGPWLDLELVFPLAGPRVVVDVDHPGILREPLLAPLDRGLQLLHGVWSGLREQLELDRLATRAEALGAVDERFGPGEFARCLPPFADELFAGDIAEFAFNQFNRDRPHVAAAHPRIRPHLPEGRHLPDGTVNEMHDRCARSRKLLRNRHGGLLDFSRCLLGHARRGAVRKHDLGEQTVGIDLGKEQERRDPAADDPAGDKQDAHGRRHHREAIVEREVEERCVHLSDEPLQATVTTPLQPGERRHEQSQRIEHDPEDREHEVLLVRQMARQDEQRFRQRHEQRGDERKRHHRDELAHHPGHEAERQEGDHRREHAGNDARDHLDRTVDRRGRKALAHPAVPVNVVADHDSVVHHDADRH